MAKRIMLTTIVLLISNLIAIADFDPCKFNFGTDWDYVSKNRNSEVSRAVDYVTIWLNDPSFNEYWHGDMLSYCKDNNKTPVFYAYIIAKGSALGDADVGGALRTKGANYIRGNWSKIKETYRNYASSAASTYGTAKPIIWLMEPDYTQYAAESQEGGGLSYSELSTKLNELIEIIKTSLPNAMISLDISPWINDQASYIGAFDMSKFSFMSNSGGRTEGGNERIRLDNNNNVTWKSVSSISGKGIIADDGYGVGGGSTGHGTDWDSEANLKARIADGVVAITQKEPSGNWGSIIATLRTQLANESIKSCGSAAVKCTLIVNVGTGGTVTRIPDKSIFSKDEKVTLTAIAGERYTFKGWSGAVTGSNATINLTMDASKTVSAQFEAIPSNMRTVTVKVEGGSGSVSKSPENGFYATGTTVVLTAKPVNGVSVFKGWSGGGVTGNDLTATLTVGSSDVVITATFEDTLKLDTIKVEAEDYSQKNGENIVIETNGDVKNIGYIESGYSTTYQIDVDIPGKYSMVFRVASGLASASFDVSVNGSKKGSVSFNGTGDNSRWQEYVNATMSGTVELKKGSNTVELSYGNALNVDCFSLIFEEPIIPVLSRKQPNVAGLKVTSQRGGFLASLPTQHGFTSFSLYDCNGKMVECGQIKAGVSELSFSRLTRNIWLLRLNGAKSSTTIKAAVLK